MNNVKKFERAREKVKGGMSVKAACEMYELNLGTYAYYKKKETQAQSTDLIVHPIPVAQPRHNRAFMIVGTPDDLADFARSMSQ